MTEENDDKFYACPNPNCENPVVEQITRRFESVRIDEKNEPIEFHPESSRVIKVWCNNCDTVIQSEEELE